VPLEAPAAHPSLWADLSQEHWWAGVPRCCLWRRGHQSEVACADSEIRRVYTVPWKHRRSTVVYTVPWKHRRSTVDHVIVTWLQKEEQRPGPYSLQSIPGYMTPLRTWSTVHVAGLLLTASPHLQDLTNEMPSGDSVVCKQSNAAFSCALGQGKSPSYMTCHITGAHITGYILTVCHRWLPPEAARRADRRTSMWGC